MILLDLDGVLADFWGDALRTHGRVVDYATRPPGEYDIPKALGISDAEFWAKIDANGNAWPFWAFMRLYPWAKQLYEGLKALDDGLVFVSSPPEASFASAGKITWIQTHFGCEAARDLLLVPSEHKRLLASRRTVLLDDSSKNCAQFRAAGGEAVLFPQPWNEGYGEAFVLKDDPLADLHHVITTVAAAIARG